MKLIYAIGTGLGVVISAAALDYLLAQTWPTQPAQMWQSQSLPLPYCSDLVRSGNVSSAGSGMVLCAPDDRAKIEIDELGARVEELERQMKNVIVIQR